MRSARYRRYSSAVVRLPRSIYFRDVPKDIFHDMILLQTLLSLLSGPRVLQTE